jgi:hypothetical protein
MKPLEVGETPGFHDHSGRLTECVWPRKPILHRIGRRVVWQLCDSGRTAKQKGMTDAQHMHLLAIIGMASETNNLVNAMLLL